MIDETVPQKPLRSAAWFDNPDYVDMTALYLERYLNFGQERPVSPPGSVHVHFLGTATLSFGDGVETSDSDVFEIEAPPFRLPIRNPRRCAPDEGCVTVVPL